MNDNKQLNPYNTVKAFLECLEPEKYNFEFECKFKCEDDRREYEKFLPVERYLIYRATKAYRNDNKNPKCNSVYSEGGKFAANIQDSGKYVNLGDCDGSETGGNLNLIYDLYLKLWGWEKGKTTFGKLCNEAFKCEFGGDTINSVQTIFSAVSNDVLSRYDDFKGQFSLNRLLELYANTKYNEKFVSEIQSQTSFVEYLNTYHTLGNFVLVPIKFNWWRGFNCKINDYWDLSLEHLKNNGWENAFNPNGNNVADYRRYINYFFLWDYVDNDGNAIPLLHRDVNDMIAKENFLKATTVIINRRGFFMVAMLKLEQALGTEKYAMLRNDVFAKDDAVYSGYDAVFAAVEAYLEKNGACAEAKELLETAQKSQINHAS